MSCVIIDSITMRYRVRTTLKVFRNGQIPIRDPQGVNFSRFCFCFSSGTTWNNGKNVLLSSIRRLTPVS
jgi:hypothetical protein